LNVWKAFTSYDPELFIPLTFLSYQLDYTIGGMQPFMFHLTNLMLHILSAVCVSGIAFRLRKNWWIAGAAGLLFVVHPLNTEAVMWASAQKICCAPDGIDSGRSSIATPEIRNCSKPCEARCSFFAR